ncbi:hypothetical protein BW33_02186 [Pseudomonas sp. RIT288]|nr:hypothetical protein BW33_02186 [Pseudomonas sp. RIT288]
MAQSVSHHTMSLKGMAMISAAEKPVSLARRLASPFNVGPSNLVVLDQTKIAFLQAHVVDQLEGHQILFRGLR